MLSQVSRIRITPRHSLGHVYRLCNRLNSGEEFSKLFLLPLNRSSLIQSPAGSVRSYDRKYSSDFKEMYSQLNKYIDKLLNRNENLEAEDASTHKWGKSVIIENAMSETEAEPIHEGVVIKEGGKISEKIISVETQKVADNLVVEENTDAEVIMFTTSKGDESGKGAGAPAESKPSPISQQMDIMMKDGDGQPPSTKKTQDLNAQPPPISQQMDVQVEPNPQEAEKGPNFTASVTCPQERGTEPSPIQQMRKAEKGCQITALVKNPQKLGTEPSPTSHQMEVQVPQEAAEDPYITALVPSPQELDTHGAASHTKEILLEPGCHLVTSAAAGQPSTLTVGQAKPNKPEAPASGIMLQDPASNIFATESNVNVSASPSTTPEGDPKPSGSKTGMPSEPPASGTDPKKFPEEEHPIFFKTKDELVQILKEISDRVNEYEAKMANLEEQPLAEEISMEEYCDIGRHPLRTDEGTESFWPHTEEEQKVGPVGISLADEKVIDAKPLLTEEGLQAFEEKMIKKMAYDDGTVSVPPGSGETPKAEVPPPAKEEKTQGPSDEEATKK